MDEYIKCRNCSSPDCHGCNVYTLATMLNTGKFDFLMNGNRCVDRFADVAPVVHGSMRVEVTTDDFVNRELASNCGWYRKHYFCPSCGQKLKEETYEKDHCFASWDLVREGCSLHYCPNCGARMRGVEDE